MKLATIVGCLTAVIVGTVVFFVGAAIKPTKGEETPEPCYHAFRYQRVVFIAEGRVTAGPEKFGVVKSKSGAELVKVLATKLPVRDEDKPQFAMHASDKLTETVVFGSFTPITKDEYDTAVKSKAVSISLEP